MAALKSLAMAMVSLASTVCAAGTVTDTLVSKQGSIILTYDISQRERQFTIQFRNVQKRLGPALGEKYGKKLPEIVPMFFDRTGSYDNGRFKGIIPEAFMKPAGVEYTKSEDGWISIVDGTSVSLSLKSGDASEISIPVYLTHYEKKGRYTVLCHCGDLQIPLKIRDMSMSGESTGEMGSTVVSTLETEADNSDITEALGAVDLVMGLLEAADGLPFSDILTMEIVQLRTMRSKMKDAATLERINSALDAYDAKRMELEDMAAAAKQEEIAQAEQEEKAREAEAMEKEEKSRKRTIWMIVGGAILSVGCLAGNQALQHFRDMSNRRSMQEMQDRMVKQAESEAVRRAQSYAHNKVHQAGNKVKNSARNAVGRLRADRSPKGGGPKAI